MEKSLDGIYFAAKEPEELAGILIKKKNNYFAALEANGFFPKIRKLYSIYHGLAFDDLPGGGHEIKFEGEQGELVSINVNHLRNFAENILTLITASRPSLETRAINTDAKSQQQTRMADIVLDYYMREKGIENLIRLATEYSLIYTKGFVKLGWNSTSGESREVDDLTGLPIYEGDVDVDLFDPFHIFYDLTQFKQRKDWYVTITYKNKFDIMAKYPEYAEKIKDIRTKNESSVSSFMFNRDMETSDIPVFEFLHNRTDSIPDGRLLLFLSEDVVLYDGPLPYDGIPIYEISPKTVLGTQMGYTPLFDLMPLNDVANMLYSTILTNQSATGVQSIITPVGSLASYEQLSSGANLIEYNPAMGKPEALQLTSTPKEIFDFLSITINTMETLIGVNSTVRGNPEANLRSGSSLALIQSNAIQYMSGFAQQYNSLIEDVGTGLLKMLKTFAKTKRMASIVGLSNRSNVLEFSGKDFTNISRVIVTAGNPLAKTTAGRLQMASELLQYGAISDPKLYLNLVQTGNLDQMVENDVNNNIYIKKENEALLAGKNPPVLLTDEHVQHLKQHKAILNDIGLRDDVALVNMVLAHMQEHMDILTDPDPVIQMKLQLLGQQGMPPAPDAPNQATSDGVANLSVPAGATDPNEMPDNNPNLPKGPEGFEDVPVTAEQMNNNLRS